MISKLNLEHILFLDIETVPETENFNDLDTVKQELWDAKSKYQRRDEFSAEEFYDRAGIWAEFGKIICISVGYFHISGDIREFRVTSFYGDEIKLLKEFKNLVKSVVNACLDEMVCNTSTKHIKQEVLNYIWIFIGCPATWQGHICLNKS